MSKRRLLLCTDMDRTVMPNGLHEESELARPRFQKFTSMPDVRLAYVTGRDKALVEEAMNQYQLPLPDYAITDVGTKIYFIEEGEWKPSQEWEQDIGQDWKGMSGSEIHQLLADVDGLQLQETSKQNDHKLSYYVSEYDKQESLSKVISERLQERGIKANQIWSMDDLKGIGLLDILPQAANKLHAINFLYQLLGYTLEEVVFAGDSGNDLAVLTSPIHSVLVANATDEVRAEAIEMATEKATLSTLYVANGNYLEMNGCYTAGVLEGVWHFASAFHADLQELL